MAEICQKDDMTEEEFHLQVNDVHDSVAVAKLMIEAANRAQTNLRGSLRQIEREHKANLEKERKAEEARHVAALGLPAPKGKAKAKSGAKAAVSNVLTINVSSHSEMASVEMGDFDPAAADYSKCFVVKSADTLKCLNADNEWKIQFAAFKVGLPQAPQAQLRGRANSDITSFDASRGSAVRKAMLNFLRGANVEFGKSAHDPEDLEAVFTLESDDLDLGEDEEMKAAAEKLTAFTKKAYFWGMLPSRVVCATGGHLLAQLKYQESGSRVIRAVSLAKLSAFFSVREAGKSFTRSDLEEKFGRMTQEEADALKEAGTSIEHAQVTGPCIVFQPPGYVASEMAVSSACHGVRIETIVVTPGSVELYKVARSITPEGSASEKAITITNK